jgi:4-diphosphocytidyl-2-C-methyl-D-erythritol kinase
VRAYAKINLALVVGPARPDGKHEVATVLQHVGLYDDIELDPGDAFAVEGYPDDTLVRAALLELASAARVDPAWRVRIAKRIPVAAGLGGGSSDAAAALVLANALLPAPLSAEALDAIAAGVGADVPFFLGTGPQLGTGDGSELAPVDLPQDYVVLVVLPAGEAKRSTAAVYRGFDERSGAAGFDRRRESLTSALARVEQARDLATLPRNDLASSPLSAELEALGAFRSDITGAGPVVYGLFERREDAEHAAAMLEGRARTWLVRPVAGGARLAR